MCQFQKEDTATYYKVYMPNKKILAHRTRTQTERKRERNREMNLALDLETNGI